MLVTCLKTKQKHFYNSNEHASIYIYIYFLDEDRMIAESEFKAAKRFIYGESVFRLIRRNMKDEWRCDGVYQEASESILMLLFIPACSVICMVDNEDCLGSATLWRTAVLHEQKQQGKYCWVWKLHSVTIHLDSLFLITTAIGLI